MQCLSEAQIQAVADREAAEDLRRHAASCARCGERVREREALTAAMVAAIDIPSEMPPAVGPRVSRALDEAASRGATRLRHGSEARRQWYRTPWSAAAVAAATLMAIVFVAPLMKGPSTVSASEVLAKSAGRLAEPVGTGVETLDYELTLDGVPRELMPEYADGVYRVRQLIDHDSNGRYLVAAYNPQGQLLSAVSQDPARQRRVMTVRLDDQLYRFDVDVSRNEPLSLPELERLHMQASVAMMQASGNQHLQVVEGATGRQYRIEVPQVGAQVSNAMWDLSEARVLVDADDYHIVEFAVKGTFLKQSYSVAYRLIGRTVSAAANVAASEFEVPAEPGAIEIEGEGSAIPARDALVLALRELAKTKQGR